MKIIIGIPCLALVFLILIFVLILTCMGHALMNTAEFIGSINDVLARWALRLGQIAERA